MAVDVSHIDKVILNTTIAAIENINLQADIIFKELARYAWDSEDVKILLSMTGIDMLSAMLIATEIVDVKRFCTPWKLVSYAGLAPRTRESSGKTRTGRISKQGSPWLRWILVQCAMTAVRYDQRLKSFYERLKSRKGSAKAILSTAKEILVILWYMLTRRERYMNKERYEQKLSRIKKIKESAA
jgi:transposase